MFSLDHTGPHCDPVSRQIGCGLGNSRLQSLGTHCYEGDMTNGPRVSRRTLGRAREAIGRRTNPTRQRQAIEGAGLTTAGGGLRRTAQGRQLTPGQLAQRTQARANFRNSGTAAGRQRTSNILTQARRDRGRAGRVAQRDAARAITR